MSTEPTNLPSSRPRYRGVSATFTGRAAEYGPPSAEYGPPSADQIRAIGFMVRQGRTTVRDWLASDTSLSLPASKETPDAR